MVTVRLAVWVKAGMPRSTAVAWRAASSSIWASLPVAAARLTLSPSASPGQPCCWASVMRSAQVVADGGQAGPLGWVGPQEGAADAAVLVDAAGPVGAAAVAERDLAALEVAEELLPFGVGGGAVFLAGAQGTAAGDEGPVAVDDFLGIDGLVAHGGVDVAVAGDELGDVRRHPVHDRVGDEHPSEVVGREPRAAAPAASVSPVRARAMFEQLPDGLRR